MDKSSSIGPRQLSKEKQDEKLAAFDSVPLFMKNMPDNAEDVTLAALQNLVYEGTPDEVAQNFKEQGNEYYKGKRYREALGFYTQGIDANPTDLALQEALLCNRAACNLELQNYGSTLRDCSKAIGLNPRSSKAYYRSALALLALNRVEEAVDCCDRCLTYNINNDGITMVRERAMKEKARKDLGEKERAERMRKAAEANQMMDFAFRERNLVVIPRKEGSTNPYSPRFDPDDPSQSTLIIPVFFLYPQYATSDVIQDFAEDTPFASHISAMFPPQVSPPEWDKAGEYKPENLVIYAMTCRKRLLKVGKRMTLRDVCNAVKGKEGEPRDGLEVKDGCLTFVILPKGKVETKWVEEYKKSRDV